MIGLVAILSVVLAESGFDAQPSVTDLSALAQAAYHFEAPPADASLGAWSDPALEASPTAIDPADPAPRPFGLAETANWMLNAGIGTNFLHHHMGRTGIGIDYFIADDIALDFELNFLYFSQPGDDAIAGNLNLILRWHFWHNESRSWTVYGDAGAGILYASEDVPPGGSRFNFTPQIGAGMSFDLGNDLRLYAGTRWHHASNARLYKSNPGDDLALFYVMLSWPF